MKARTGATLIEVLVAIFVMGIGLLALLTLFPIGVLTMRQAIQDDRTAHASASASAIAKMQFKSALHDPWFKKADHDQAAPALADALPQGPGYSLYLDAVGISSYLQPTRDWVAGQTNGIRRLNFSCTNYSNSPGSPVNCKPIALFWQISPDDIGFDKKGLPATLAAGPPPVFERNSAYSWAYLVRRPMYGKPSVVDLTVVVYNERPLALNQNLQAGETLYNATFNPNGNIVTITWAAGQPQPALNVGGWILDSTPVMVQAGPPPVFGPPHARFYRVVSIVQTGANSADLEVQSPIKDFPLPAPHPANTYAGFVVVIEGIAEVFEKGPVQWQQP